MRFYIARYALPVQVGDPLISFCSVPLYQYPVTIFPPNRRLPGLPLSADKMEELYVASRSGPLEGRYDVIYLERPKKPGIREILEHEHIDPIPYIPRPDFVYRFLRHNRYVYFVDGWVGAWAVYVSGDALYRLVHHTPANRRIIPSYYPKYLWDEYMPPCCRYAVLIAYGSFHDRSSNVGCQVIASKDNHIVLFFRRVTRKKIHELIDRMNTFLVLYSMSMTGSQ
ncbi:MAG: hypothetical protein QXP81_09410 [Nitrososphaerota archaeon]